MRGLGELIDGKYRVTRKLGSGGMGAVLEAEHVDLGRCAIKVMSPDALRHHDAYERFRREAKAARQLTSKHVVRVFDFGKLPSGEPYLVMELLEGRDLQVLFEEHGRLPLAQVAAYVRQACDALSEAHAAGIVHRDIKPANLFLAQSNKGAFIKVLDFGIAKLTAPPGHGGSKEMTGERRLGTLAYMSPEQLRETRGVDARADIWSLGVVLHRLVTGELPFDGESVFVVAQKILREPPVPPSSIVPGLPATFDEVVARCLAKDSAERYSTAEELEAALGPLCGGLASDAPRLGSMNAPAPGSATDPTLSGAPRAAVTADATTVPVADDLLLTTTVKLPAAGSRAASATERLTAAPWAITERVPPSSRVRGGSGAARAWTARALGLVTGVAAVSAAGIWLLRPRDGTGAAGVAEAPASSGPSTADTAPPQPSTEQAASGQASSGQAASGQDGSEQPPSGPPSSEDPHPAPAGSEPGSVAPSAAVAGSGAATVSTRVPLSPPATRPGTKIRPGSPVAGPTPPSPPPTVDPNDPLGLKGRRKIGN